MNESNSSQTEHDEFFQASQNNMVEFTKNIENNVENEITNSAEDSSSGAVYKVLNEYENVACLGVIDLKVNLSAKML